MYMFLAGIKMTRANEHSFVFVEKLEKAAIAHGGQEIRTLQVFILSRA